MSNHTPGPWSKTVSKVKRNEGQLIVVASTGLLIATINDQKFECDDNARLIAAAPDLLAAAQKLEAAETFHANCTECEGEEVPKLCEKCFPHFDDARVMRRLAIAKATGKTPGVD